MGNGCRHILLEEYDIIREEIQPPFFVATQFFYTLSFITMLLAIIFVVMYLLCVDEYYRVSVLKWTGIDLIVGGKTLHDSKVYILLFTPTFWTFTPLHWHCVKTFALLFRHFWNHSSDHFWSFGRRTRLHARLGAQLPIVVFWVGICWSRFRLRSGSAFLSRSTNNAQKRNCQRQAISHGTTSLNSKIHSPSK